MNEILEKLKTAFSGIKFDAETHTYTDEFNTQYVSCTQFEDLFKLNRDWDAIRRAFAEKNGKSIEEVKMEWEASGKYATTLGTEMHAVMEYLWQGKDYTGNTEEMSKFPGMLEDFAERKKIAIQLYNRMARRYEPIANEFKVFDRDMKIAGTVDFIAYDKQKKEIVIIDWKTSKQFSKSAFKPTDTMLYPFNEYQDCNVNNYSLQLSVYKYIIERNTDLKIGKLILFQLPSKGHFPDTCECHDMHKELDKLFKRNDTDEKSRR